MRFGKLGKIRADRTFLIRLLLTTIHLCIADSPLREDVYKLAEQQKKFYYKERPSDFKIEYLDSLPKEMFNKDLFDDDEFRLMQIITNSKISSENTYEAYNYLIAELKKKKIGSVLIPILEDYDNFRTIKANISTRAYSLPVDRLERIYGIKDIKTEYIKGAENLDIVNELNEDKSKFL